MTFPDPVIEVAIEPKTKSDQEKLGTAIQKLAEEDPTFQVHQDHETGQTIIGGMGELHLDILVDRMKREFKVEANVGKPQVAYTRDDPHMVDKVTTTPTRSRPVARASSRRCSSPSSRSTGDGRGDATSSMNKVTGGRIPREYIPSVDAGAQDAMQYGVLAGYPLVDVKVDAARRCRTTRSTRRRWRSRSPARMALKEAARKAQPVILEPMMAVEVTTPEDYMGDVIGDLNSRRGQIQADGGAGRCTRRQGACAAVGDVRLRRATCARRPRAGRIYSMVFDSLRRGSAERRRRRSSRRRRVE